MTPTQQPTQLSNQPSDMTSPYRGLTPYTEADAAYFFGRTAEIATITANLEVARLTLFYGPSGVGKSSVLRAGVIHELQQRAQATFAATGVAEQIPVYFNRWASDPLLGLSQTLAQTVAPYCRQPTAPHPQPTAPLLAQLQQWSEQTDSELLLVLDQFEEFFQYHTQPGSPAPSQSWDPTSFAAQLVQLVNHSALRVHLLLSLREDTLARLDYFQGRIPFLLDNRLSIGHLDRAAGEEAVVKPLARFNQEQQSHYTIEPALVTAVLAQVGSGQVTLSRQGAGTLTVAEGDGAPRPLAPIEAPYLQLVLTRLWQQEQRNGSPVLRLTTLNDQLGGAAIIVRNYLDDTLDALTPAGRALAARFFDRLVTPSGAKIALTLAELTHYAGAEPAAVAALLDQLQAHRLLRPTPAPSGVIQYEIFHDVLGPALLDWQARYQKVQEEEQRLAEEQAARVEAEERAQIAEERAKLQAEARQQAQARVQTETRRVRQARRSLIGLSFLLILLLGTIILTIKARQDAVDNTRKAEASALAAQTAGALAQAAQKTSEIRRIEAEQQSQIAVSRELAAAALSKLGTDPELSLLLTQHALATTYTFEAEDAMRQSVQALRIIQRFSLTDTEIFAVAYSPDGTHLAAATGQGEVLIWEITQSGTASLVLTFSAPLSNTKIIYDITYSPDGTRIATAHADAKTRLWDTTSGQLLQTLSTHVLDVFSVAFSPDGKLLATASKDTTAIIWNIESDARILYELNSHSEEVTSVAFNFNGTQLATAGRDKLVILWDVASGSELQRLDEQVGGHTDPVQAIAFSPDGTRLATASLDKSVILWALGETGVNKIMALLDHTDTIADVAFSENGKCFATASLDRTVKVWDTLSGKLLLNLSGHTDWVKSVDFRPVFDYTQELPNVVQCGIELTTASSDGTVRRWNIGPSYEAHTFIGHRTPVETVAYSPDGEQIASGSDDGVVKIWNAKNHELVHTWFAHKQRVNRLEFSPNENYLLTASYDGTARLWKLSGQLVATFAEHHDKIQSVAFAYSGTSLVTGSDDGTAIVWDVQSGQPLHIFDHKQSIKGVAFSPNGELLATSGEDGQVKLWSLRTEDVILSLNHGGIVYDITFNQDGSRLATISWDTTVKLWKMPEGELLETLTGHIDRIYGVYFSPDGKQLATSSSDHTAKIWDVNTGELRQTLYGPEFNGLDFHPSGRYIIIGGEDGTVRQFFLDLDDLLTDVQKRVTRVLTLPECEQFLHQPDCSIDSFSLIERR